MAYRKLNDLTFRIVVEGLVREKRVNILYKGVGKPPAQRTISPIHIVRYRDNWYLDALCHVANAPRQFELSRIKSAKLTNQKAQKIPISEIDEFYADSYGIFSGKADKVAKIKFSGLAASIVSSEVWHPRQTREYDQSKDICILSIPYHDGRELIRDILRWAEYAEILEPHELREEIIRTIDLARTKYSK